MLNGIRKEKEKICRYPVNSQIKLFLWYSLIFVYWKCFWLTFMVFILFGLVKFIFGATTIWRVYIFIYIYIYMYKHRCGSAILVYPIKCIILLSPLPHIHNSLCDSLCSTFILSIYSTVICPEQGSSAFGIEMALDPLGCENSSDPELTENPGIQWQNCRQTVCLIWVQLTTALNLIS